MVFRIPVSAVITAFIAFWALASSDKAVPMVREGLIILFGLVRNHNEYNIIYNSG